MTEELEKKCEMIIRRHKEKGGTLVWHKKTFEVATDTTPAKQILLDLGLINKVDALNRTTSLTSKGWNFESFEKERQKPNLETEKLELELADLRRRFFDYDTIKNQAKWGLRIAAIAAIAAIIALFK